MFESRTIRITAAAALAATSAVAIGATPAAAEVTVVVTTTADVVDPADGVTSLREAFDLANGDGDDTVIELATDALYELTECFAKEPVELGDSGFFVPPDEDDANADGDLDHTESNTLTILGHGSTIDNTCLYDRVVHNVDPGSWLELFDVTVSGGISPPGEGTNIWSIGGATLDGVVVSDGFSGIGAQQAAVVVGESSADSLGHRLTMIDTSIVANGPAGVRVTTSDAVVTNSSVTDSADGAGFTITFGQLTMDGTQLVDNNGNGVSGIDAALVITDSVAGNNGGVGFRNTGNADSGQALELTDVTSIDNAGGGVECSYCTDLVVTNSTIVSNSGTGVVMWTNVVGPTMTIENSEIVDNDATLGGFTPGGGVQMEVDPGIGPTISITRSTIAGNSADGAGGGVLATHAGVEVVASTITGNAASGVGGGIAQTGPYDTSLDFVTLVDNESTGGGVNLDRDTGSLDVGGTVIALATGGDNCSAAGGTVTSLGSNQVDDATCGIGAGPADVASAGDPMLGPLGDHGGPTSTRVPLSGSPLLGAVDAAQCAAAGADQRGISRPQGAACDVGAVEENELLRAVIIAGSDPLPDPDIVFFDWLDQHDYEVEVVDDDDLDPALVAGLDDADLVVVTSSVLPDTVGGMLTDVSAPVLVSEGYLSDDMGMATNSGETTKSSRQVDVVDPTSGLGGRQTVLSQPRRMAYGIAGGDGHVIAVAKGSGEPVVYAYDAGDELADGSTAAGARGGFLFDFQAPLVARPPAFTLLDHLLELMTD